MENDSNNSLENQFILSDGSQKESYVSVEIFNQKLLLKATDVDEKYLKTIAKYIDDTSCAIKDTNPHFSDRNVLILTALNIADMLHKKQDENNEIENTVVSNTNYLHHRMTAIVDIIKNKIK